MPNKNRPGNINTIVAFAIIIALSFGVFYLAKSLSSSQDKVEAAINGRYEGYSISPLSYFMDPASKWTSFENKTYGFRIYYPSQWVAAKDNANNSKLPVSFSRALSERIKLTVTIQKEAGNIPLGKNELFDKNEFYYYQDDDLQKGAYTIHNNLHYIVQLSQVNYFGTPLEFKSVFFQILKKFEFLN